MSWWPLLVAGPLVIAGLLAYRGVWRSWAFPRPVLSYALGLGTVYLGVGLCLVLLIPVVPQAPRAVQLTLAIAGGLGIVVFLVSLFWFPSVLTPRWFRELRAQQRADLRTTA